ncbi:MAG TPA: pseudouridine synthase [Cellvibrio sp.]|nr:pseudouridine synthase [Cellvibrio sp.]
MVKKINRDKPEKPTKAVKPVVAGKPKSAEKKAVAGKSAKSNATHKRDVSDRPAKATSGKPAYKSASSPKPKATQVADEKKLAPAAPVDEKLQKVLARAGIGSRREMERAIEAGQVKVNDKIAKLGDRVMAQDKIFVNGQRVVLRSELTRRRVILYNKPEGEICSRSDPEGRPTVYGHLPPLKGERWISVGRLDFNTSGLLLFTNDGDMTAKLTHPKFEVRKVYHVSLDKKMSTEDYRTLCEGVELADGFIKPDAAEFVGTGKFELGIEIHSGKNRIVRRMFEHLGYEVVKLDRVAFAGLTKKDLPRGKFRFLTEKEISFLKMLG